MAESDGEGSALLCQESSPEIHDMATIYMVVYEKSRPKAIIQQSQSSPDRVIVSITL
jgi:hypothetical protein